MIRVSLGLWQNSSLHRSLAGHLGGFANPQDIKKRALFSSVFDLSPVGGKNWVIQQVWCTIVNEVRMFFANLEEYFEIPVLDDEYEFITKR